MKLKGIFIIFLLLPQIAVSSSIKCQYLFFDNARVLSQVENDLAAMGLANSAFKKVEKELLKLNLFDPVLHLNSDYVLDQIFQQIELKQTKIVDAYVFHSKEERLKNSFTISATKYLFKKGILNFLEQVDLKPTIKDQIRLAYYRLKASKFFQFLNLFLLNLPEVKDKTLPDGLIEKIILYGFDDYRVEVESWYRLQEKTEAYTAFRRIFQGIVVGVFLVTTIQSVQNEVQLQTERSVNQFEDQTSHLSQSLDQINNVLSKHNESLYKEHLKLALQKFKEIYNREPSSTEMVIIEQALKQRYQNS